MATKKLKTDPKAAERLNRLAEKFYYTIATTQELENVAFYEALTDEQQGEIKSILLNAMFFLDTIGRKHIIDEYMASAL